VELKGKTAIVTGASSGMGEAIALLLGAQGVKIAAFGRNEKRLQGVVERIRNTGGEAKGFIVDIRFGEEVERVVQGASSFLGGVDILINSAFWGPPGSIEKTTEEFWDMTLDTSLKGAFLCVRAVTPFMKNQNAGRIVNIGSIAGKVGEDNRTAYCAAKWGLEGLTAALRVELGKYNIHVHLVSPAATDTPFWQESGAHLSQEVLDRFIPPKMIAETVRWVLTQPDQVLVMDVPVYNFKNPFEGKGSPFEGED
jgi:NAD(P)-dependent dehydrogenase (short-subunit alcohol dehydrogenase family)